MGDEKKGVIATLGAYLMWGFFPLYWKLIADVSSEEIILNRIIWTFVLTLIFIVAIRQGPALINDVKRIWHNKVAFWSLFCAAYLITINWYLYIWAVNHDHVIETSLGYYINPLVSVLLGVIFLKEKLSKLQLIACVIAFGGVFTLLISYGTFPFVAIGLALSFGMYGLLKKKVHVQAIRGLVIEIAFIVPVAAIVYIFFGLNGHAEILNVDMKTLILVIGTGIVTAIPLILFAVGAQNIPLYLIGFIQYMTPTITLMLGIFLYDESFGKVELIAFAFVWIAIVLFSFSTVSQIKKAHEK